MNYKLSPQPEGGALSIVCAKCGSFPTTIAIYNHRAKDALVVRVKCHGQEGECEIPGMEIAGLPHIKVFAEEEGS